MKRIKDFKDWEVQEVHESAIINGIYEDLISESLQDLAQEDSSWKDEFEEDSLPKRELTRGEKVAFARELQILTNEQMAGIYLRALEIFEEANGKYLYLIPGLRNYGKTDSKGNFRIPYKNLAEALGIKSIGTLFYTIKRYLMILNEIDSDGETKLYPKIIKAAKEFSELTPKEIIPAVEKFIKIDPTRGIGPKLLAASVAKKSKLMKIGKGVDVLAKELKKQIYSQDFEKAKRVAIEKIAREMNLTNEFVASAYEQFRKPVKNY